MDPFLGEIKIFAGNYAPMGWMKCEGQILPISGNDALFAVIGKTYGGDGTTTFALPDFRGRVPLGYSANYPLVSCQ
jgi:microcystin-dependent protein